MFTTVKVAVEQKQLDKAVRDEIKKLEKSLFKEQQKNHKLEKKITELKEELSEESSDVKRARKIIDAVMTAGDLCTREYLMTEVAAAEENYERDY